MYTHGVRMFTGAVDSIQHKLMLLFVFDKMEMPLSETTVEDLCCGKNDWLNVMDCRLAFSQLIEAGFIYRINANSGHDALYTITPEGRVCLAHFFVRIPSSLRESVSECIKNNRMNYRRKQEYFSDYKKNADGTYTVMLKIVDAYNPVLDINLNVPNRNTAKVIYKKWEDKAAQVYSMLYDIFNE